MCVNVLLIISCQFILVKIKLNAFFSAEKKTYQSLTYDNNRMKQFHIVEYFGYYLDAGLRGESRAMTSLKKINTKVQFLYRQNKFLIQNYVDCSAIL